MHPLGITTTTNWFMDFIGVISCRGKPWTNAIRCNHSWLWLCEFRGKYDSL